MVRFSHCWWIPDDAVGDWAVCRLRAAGRSDQRSLPVPVLGEIQVRFPDQRTHELRLTRRRQAELGGLARLVLEKPREHFLVLRGQPNGEGLAKHVIICSRNEYKSIRDAGRRHYAGRDVFPKTLMTAEACSQNACCG